MKKRLAKILALALCAILLVTGTVFVTLAFLQDQTGVVQNTFSSANIRITLHEAIVNEQGMPIAYTGQDGTTVAYPTADEIKNLTPTVLDKDQVASASRWSPTAGSGKLGNNYHLIPGATYVKDPKITIKAGSEKCFLFFAMKNTMLPKGNSIEKTGDGYRDIYTQIENYGWEPFANTDGTCKYNLSAGVLEAAGLTDSWNEGDYMIFYHNRVFDAKNSDIPISIFDGFTVSGDLGDEIKTWNDKNGNGQKETGEELVIELIAFAVQAQGFTESDGSTDLVVDEPTKAFLDSGFGVVKST